jgi:hypothetical protein
VTDNPTRLLSQLLALTDNPDAISFEEQAGETFIVLGAVSLALSLSSQAALDRLAVVTAEAAAVNRGRTLREVA